jgi:hypothetical protein
VCVCVLSVIEAPRYGGEGGNTILQGRHKLIAVTHTHTHTHTHARADQRIL